MNASGSRFGPETLAEVLTRFDCTNRYLAAISGGADSTALLAALAEARPMVPQRIEAVHVHHGVHPHADAWQHHCEVLCERLDVPLRTLRIRPSPASGDSPEAELRRLRYEALAGCLETGDLLLTAHHLEDQAETVLLNLMRGSGADGLAGMPENRPLGRGRLVRPLLGRSRAELREYLTARSIDWIDDPGNIDTRFDRNFLRTEVLPLLRARWPAADSLLARSARLSRESTLLLRRYVREWLHVRLRDGRVLPLNGLEQEDEAALRAVIREWMRFAGAPPVPGARLFEFTRQLATSGTDSRTSLQWNGWALRRHNARLWLLEPGPVPACPDLRWTGRGPLDLGAGMGRLEISGSGGGACAALRVRGRRPGDAMQLAGRSHHSSVKELLRTAGVPPWLRDAIPLVEADGNIVSVGDWAVAAGLPRVLGGERATLLWHPDDPLLRTVRADCHGEPVARDG